MLPGREGQSSREQSKPQPGGDGVRSWVFPSARLLPRCTEAGGSQPASHGLTPQGARKAWKSWGSLHLLERRKSSQCIHTT